MAKLSLIAKPTFPAKVGIPVAGGDAVDVTFTFKHRTKAALDEFIQSRPEKEDSESVMDLAIGWDLDDAFTVENVELLLQNYMGAALAIYRAYVDELVKAKTKN